VSREVKLVRGFGSAVLNFVLVGIVIPEVLLAFAPDFSAYIKLPPSTEIWEVFLLFGVLLAVTNFCLNGYSKGEFPWLFGKIGLGLVDVGLFYFLFLLIPGSLNAAGATSSESSGLIYLVGLAVALSYGYIVLDFVDARRTLASRPSLQPQTQAKA
jgi:hypothetical protein